MRICPLGWEIMVSQEPPPGNHIAARAQEFLLSEVVVVDARVTLLEAVYVCLVVHMSRQLAVESSVTEVPRRVVQRRTPPSTFPEGGTVGRGRFE